VQETQEDLQNGVVIFMPIYTDQAQIPGASDSTLLGWAFSPLRIKDVVNSALAGVYNPDLAGSGVLVFDGTEPLARNVLYDNLNLMASDGLSHPYYQKLTIAGRTWLVGVQLAPRLVGPNGIGSTFWIAMLIGSTISMVAAVISRILVSNHLTTRTALAVSEAASRELSLSSTVFEESSQGILVTNPQGRILMANNAFTQPTGYRISEIKGQGANLLKSGRHDNAFSSRCGMSCSTRASGRATSGTWYSAVRSEAITSTSPRCATRASSPSTT